MTVLEAVWGDGYMSPGGPDKIRSIDGVALTSMKQAAEQVSF